MSATIDELLESIAYDPVTGAFTREDGSDATCSAGNGYRGVAFNGLYIHAHRLAWYAVYGKLPERNIDHINGDPGDNRLANLRLATQRQNCQNRRVMRTSKSGIKGVSFDANRKKWCAYICVDGRQTFLGRFTSADAAASAYRNAATKHFGEFARV